MRTIGRVGESVGKDKAQITIFVNEKSTQSDAYLSESEIGEVVDNTGVDPIMYRHDFS